MCSPISFFRMRHGDVPPRRNLANLKLPEVLKQDLFTNAKIVDMKPIEKKKNLWNRIVCAFRRLFRIKPTDPPIYAETVSELMPSPFKPTDLPKNAKVVNVSDYYKLIESTDLPDYKLKEPTDLPRNAKVVNVSDYYKRIEPTDLPDYNPLEPTGPFGNEKIVNLSDYKPIE